MLRSLVGSEMCIRDRFKIKMNPKYHSVAGKLAKGLEPFVNIYRLPLELKPINVQKMELNGDLPFDLNKYHNQEFENLVKKVNKNRFNFM